MEMRQMEMLLAVVEQGGYLNAGEHMHLSHSAIHRQIRLLEEELGQKLLVRSGRTVQPTEAGKILLTFAARVKQEVSAIEQQILDLKELAGGELRIGTGTTTLSFFLPPVLEAFHALYPRVDLKIITGTADHLIHELQAGTLDIGLVSEPLQQWPSEKNLNYDRLYEEEFALIANKAHPLAARETIDWSDLKGVPIITFPDKSRVRRVIDQCFQDHDVPQRIVMELENEEAIESMIRLNLGVGFVARRRLNTVDFHRLHLGGEPILLSIAAVSNASYVPRRAKEFLRLCRRHATGANLATSKGSSLAES
jgi:LysR family cyn operon transcriptional activator